MTKRKPKYRRRRLSVAIFSVPTESLPSPTIEEMGSIDADLLAATKKWGFNQREPIVLAYGRKFDEPSKVLLGKQRLAAAVACRLPDVWCTLDNGPRYERYEA